MEPSEIRIRPLRGMPEIQPGDNLSNEILAAVARESSEEAEGRHLPGDGSIFVVAQKVVSKAEGRLVRLEGVVPSLRAHRWAAQYGKDPRVVEVVLQQARRIVRMDRGILIAETRHGYICANAGVDASNAPPGTVVLLPEDPDRSAETLRRNLTEALGILLAVVVSDTFGRPWRRGLTNVALGVAGMSPLIDYRGREDGYGRKLRSTILAAADEIAAAAELVMGKTLGIPVAVVEGFSVGEGSGSGKELIRPRGEDLFR